MENKQNVNKEKENKEKVKMVNKRIFSTREQLLRYGKRYALVLAIASPVMIVLNYILGKVWSDYTGAVAFFGCFAMLLTSCLLGLVYYTKKDDREKQTYDPEDDHDPFAD